jgi:predicted esterase
MILVHGRGATAPSILELASALPSDDMVYLAPQAMGNTWYPTSFLSPREQNEPGISSGLKAIESLIDFLNEAGIPTDRIVLGGFSQGACLSSEFVATHPARYGGLLVFSGGLIGPQDAPLLHEGNLEGTPVFIGCSDTDFHIPLERVEETARVLADMGADVTKKIYPGMGHTIIQDEIDEARRVMEALHSQQDG